MIKQTIFSGARSGQPQPFGDNDMREQVVSCLKQSVMTIFIFSYEKAFYGFYSKFGRCRTVFFACAILCAAWSPVQAVRFPSAKDMAQGDTLYQQAFTAYEAADYVQAQTLIEKADTLKPDQPDGWNLRGMIYLKQNAFNKAEAAFARAVALDPKLWAAQFNLAEAPFQGKDYARARSRFETLLGQTDHFKDAKKWELVQYKAFLSCLLMGDIVEADRKLGRLPATGGVTPAYQYAQAALAYNRKDAAGARRLLAVAQTTFTPVLNELFSNSLVEIGWEAPSVPLAVVAANAPLPEGPTANRESSGHESSNREFMGSHAPIVIDPQLEAAVAEPLPSPDSTTHPVISTTKPTSSRPAFRTDAAPPKWSTPTPAPDETTNHRGLLLE